MKKRILALLLSCLLLSGCGGQQLSNAVSGGLNNPKKPSAPTAPATETEKPASKPEEPAGAGAEGAEPSSEPQTETSVGVEQEQSSVLEQLPPKIVISSSYSSRFDSSVGVNFGVGTLPLFFCGDAIGARNYNEFIDDPNYPALAAALRACNEERAKTFAEDMDMIENAARGDYVYGNYPGVSDYNMVYRSEGIAWLERADCRLVSFAVEEYWHSGGAHPYTGYSGLTFDSQSGARVKLAELINPSLTERFGALFEKALFAQYTYFRDGLLVDSVADTVNGQLKEDTLQYTVDYTGVTILISPYELASYATGPAFVRMDFADYPGLFAEKATTVPADWVKALRPQADTSYYSPLNTVSVRTAFGERKLNVQYIPDDYEAGTSSSLTVRLDDAEWEAPDFFGYGVYSYLFHKDGKDYLYLEDLLPNDYRWLYILDISGSAPVYVGQFQEGVGLQMPSDPNSFLLSRRCQALSTYNVARHYALSDSGLPEPLDELYYACSTPELTLRQELLALEQLPDGVEDSLILPAGTKLYVYATDTEETVILIDEAGNRYRVSYDHGDDYYGTVNGVPLMDAFDGAFFAG